MSKKTEVLTLILSVIALGMSAAAVIAVTRPADSAAPAMPDLQYVLYLGTNDKDTNQPVFSPEESKAKLEEILLDYFGGYTIQEAEGGWVDGDTTYQEYTLVIYLSDTSLEQVHGAADELLNAFNQTSVLIQANQTTTEFYGGGD